MEKLNLSPNALRVLEARYLRRDEDRRIVETPAELFESVARGVAFAEQLLGSAGKSRYWEDQFYGLMSSLDFLPNTPTLMNAGKPLGQLSACFVLPVEDSIEGIFDAVKNMALVQRTGGGTGFSFSRLRPKGDLVLSTAGESSGPVSFMKIFDCATDNIKQGGKRRGANMGILRVDHPDILEFIWAKRDGAILQNFNLSVAVTDDFMNTVKEDGELNLVHPHGGIRGSLPARAVFHAMAEAAWLTGDPGLVFLDAINRSNPTPHVGAIEATNPCGEIPLLPFESCNLGSINLAHMLRRDDGPAAVDWERLGSTVRVAVRFLDDVIEVSKYPIPEIGQMTRGNRKIGLGVMGFAEMLIRLGVSYDSDEAIQVAEKLMSFIALEAEKASRDLAEERGVFHNWKGSALEAKGLRVRNATRTAIAPTGTIGIIAGTSPSIEPLFALAYRRSHVLGDQTLYDVNPLFLEYLDRHRLSAQDVLEQVLRQGSIRGVTGVPEELKRLFVTALEIPPRQHVQIQAAFQRHVDNSVSKTVNLPREATVQDVADAYRSAWELGLKGITIYRYGSKLSQVLELGVGEEAHHYEHASKCDPGECKV
ncbi:MAG: adenosylcobalamin-dependent ribonucleoside-diphosphate reductase [Deltaproteobacteria bacterium]